MMPVPGSFHDLSSTGRGGADSLVDALGRIDGEARLVLALLFVEGLNEAEVAAALDRPVEHVRTLAAAAQRALAASVAGGSRRAA